MEFSWWAALYAQLGAAHPRLSMIVIAAIFAVMGGGCWALIGADYQRQVRERDRLTNLPDEALRAQLGESVTRLAQLESKFDQVERAVTAEREAKERALAELDNKKQRQELREQLGELFANGVQLRDSLRSSKEDLATLETQANAWFQNVQHVLKNKLGESYRAQFAANRASAFNPGGVPAERVNLWKGLDLRLDVLEKFIDELK